LTNKHSIADFQRNPKGILWQLRKTRNPVVLTVKGKPELVVQDAESYQLLLERVAAAEDLDAIREGLVQSLSGQGRSAEEFFADFEAKRGI
jgi:prevent-host-death family protein